MSETDQFILIVLTFAVGGAYGAYKSGSDWWRGSTAMVGSYLLTALAIMGLGRNGIVFSLVLNVAIFAICGMAFKMNARQMMTTFLVGTLLMIIGAILGALFGAFGIATSRLSGG
ncbi:hypothetical protein [Agrobacterium tumefaciens]|uniref:hypothetical protein n=1 Tax=Agrobacterium tumefaciens TaxID=358 RepID=UPI000EF23B98|nr:hypothetical protein [Agrobacterium tumefaciens]AYM05636.1 hypothetical protein At1D1460_13940 [Agrobacterium tumefaciens]NSZ32466.1 hypothetical protein [Agrobacterium tumefaciens]QLG22093.1 hypothetical protein EML4_07045 [Agrobacterium tumefaciens]UXS85983.1 hypothetical protein FY144_07020 [Agrobacterium tumefaciens]